MLWLWWLKSCRCSLCNVANPPSIKRVITFNAKYTYSSTKKSQNRARVNETFQLNYCSIMKPVVRVIKIFNNCITDMNTTFLQNFEPSENTWKLSQNTVNKWRNSEEKCRFATVFHDKFWPCTHLNSRLLGLTCKTGVFSSILLAGTWRVYLFDLVGTSVNNESQERITQQRHAKCEKHAWSSRVWWKVNK